MSPALFFWLLLKASLFSTGGTGNLPSLRADLLARRWAADRTFVEALTIGQVSPGPNGLWVISLAYMVDGVTGALLAVVAITIPPMLVIPIEHAYRRVRDHPAAQGFTRGMGLGVVGIFAMVLAQFLKAEGIGPRTIAITVAAVALGITRRVPVPAIIGLGAAAGLLWR